MTDTEKNPDLRMEETSGTDTLEENRRIWKIAFLAFVLNLVLAGIKGYLAYTSGSLAVTAGAIDSATDGIASLAVFAGLLLSTRRTRTFPQGLYKIENLISVVIAFFILFTGYEIARRIFQPSTGRPDITLPLLWWILGSTAATFAFGKYALHQGKKTESPTLIAEGRHRQVDVLSSLVVLISVVLSYYGIAFRYRFLTIDRIAALLVLVFIIKAGWELLSDGMRVLLDASVDHATLDKARAVIAREPAVREINSLVGRNAGRFRFLDADITIKTDQFKKAHDIVHRIERRIREEIPHVERINLHYAPSESKTLRIAFPVLEDGETICDHFGDAPYFLIWQVNRETGETERKTVLKNPCAGDQKGKGIQAARFLVDRNIDVMGARKKLDGSGPGYVFADAGIETWKVSGAAAPEALKRFTDRTPS